MEENQLELLFRNENGSMVRISIPSPVDPVDPSEVNAAMDTIIAENIFFTSGGELVEKSGARLVSRTVSEIVL